MDIQGCLGMEQAGFPEVMEPAKLSWPQAALWGAPGSPCCWKNLHIRGRWGYVSGAQLPQWEP